MKLAIVLRVALVITISCCATFGAEPKLLPQKLLDEGWISLFDGETLYGWQPVGDAEWEVVGGEVRTKGDKPGFLMTTTEWADYRLHVEFRAPAATNSGIFLRSALEPADPATDCVELNIAPRKNPFPTGSFVARRKLSTKPQAIHIRNAKGEVISIEHTRELNAWDGKWHTLDVAISGSKAWLKLDGKMLDTVELSTSATGADVKTPPIGHIGLQSNSGPVSFRNIRLIPEGERSTYLNVSDLSTWNTERAENCEFRPTRQGYIQILNGPGQLETKNDYKDFVAQLRCKVNGDGLNSGVFFRTLREGRWAGYESQINNKFKDGDPTKPADFGTGGIYRRQPARRVVAEDYEWLAMTIVADGPHFAVWVNGYQVSDWTDDRPEKENAREGLRLGGGAIAFQGHDATTDLVIRTLRVTELPR